MNASCIASIGSLSSCPSKTVDDMVLVTSPLYYLGRLRYEYAWHSPLPAIIDNDLLHPGPIALIYCKPSVVLMWPGLHESEMQWMSTLDQLERHEHIKCLDRLAPHRMMLISVCYFDLNRLLDKHARKMRGFVPLTTQSITRTMTSMHRCCPCNRTKLYSIKS